MNQINVQMEDIFRVFSWIYSLAWCLSFYGQICQNFKRKNVEGMNLNFAVINLNGFIFYALYNSYGYFIDDNQTGTIQMADLFFSLHALAATFFTGMQAFIYPRGQNKVSNSVFSFIAGQWIILIVYYSLVKLQIINQNQTIGYVILMGYYKLMCSLFKYIPQLLWNRKRQSTIGWSIFNVLMDLTGGIFSVSEIILEINITKLLLGSLTIVYDILFVYQHYILYPYTQTPREQTMEQINTDSPSTLQRQLQSQNQIQQKQ